MDVSSLSSINPASLNLQDASIEASVAIMKKAMNVAVSQQAQLVQMMRQISPHLGQNVNITA